MGAKLGQNNVKGERTRIAILSAAQQVFAESGYRGSSLAVIAERAGITQSGLLHHFRTKEALLQGVLQLVDATDAALLDRPLSMGGLGVVEGLRDVIVTNAEDRLAVRLLAVLVAESSAVEHPGHEFMKERYQRLRDRVAGSLAVGARDGVRLPDRRPEILANVLIALMDGIQLQWVYDHRVDTSAAFDLVASALHAALVGRAAAIDAG